MTGKPKTYSGHGDVHRRRMSAKQKTKLLQKGKIEVSVLGHKKTVRKQNVKKTGSGWYYEWYERSDKFGAPALRDYARDDGTFATHRPSKAKGRKFEGDAGMKRKKGQKVQRKKRY